MESYITEAMKRCINTNGVNTEQLHSLFLHNLKANLKYLSTRPVAYTRLSSYDRAVWAAERDAVLWSVENSKDDDAEYYLGTIINDIAECCNETPEKLKKTFAENGNKNSALLPESENRTSYGSEGNISALRILIHKKFGNVTYEDIRDLKRHPFSNKKEFAGTEWVDVVSHICHAYGFYTETELKKDPNVQKGIERIKKKIFEATENEDMLGPYKDRLETNIPVSLMRDCIRGANAGQFCFSLYAQIAPDEINISEEEIDQVLTDLAYTYVIGFLMEHTALQMEEEFREETPDFKVSMMKDRLTDEDAESVIKRLSVSSTKCIFRDIRMTDANVFATAAYFALLIHIIKQTSRSFFVDAMKFQCMKNSKTMEQKLKEERDKVIRLERENKMLREGMKESRQESERRRIAAISDSERTIQALRKENARLIRENKELSLSVDTTDNDSESCEPDLQQIEKLTSTSTVRGDKFGKYLFVTQNEFLAKRLKEFFPNARTSDKGYPYKMDTLKTLDAVIVIYSSVQHGEMHRWQEVKRYLPVHYTNTQNMDRLLNEIAAMGFTEKETVEDKQKA